MADKYSRSEKRVLVIGCKSFSSVDSISWEEMSVPNIPDYDLIIISGPHLTESILQTISVEFLKELRESISQFLYSHGRLVALISPTIRASREDLYPKYVESDDWSPIYYRTPEEPGKSILRVQDKYQTYLGNMNEWGFRFQIPTGWARDALRDSLRKDLNFKISKAPYLTSRYEAMLAGEFHLEMNINNHGLLNRTNKNIVFYL